MKWGTTSTTCNASTATSAAVSYMYTATGQPNITNVTASISRPFHSSSVSLPLPTDGSK